MKVAEDEVTIVARLLAQRDEVRLFELQLWVEVEWALVVHLKLLRAPTSPT